MKVAVTGAAGLTGGRVTRLLAEHHEVTAVVRSQASAGLVDSRARIAVLDCRDTEELSRVVQTVDALVHVAGIQLSESVANACMEGRPARVLAVSTASALLAGHPHAAIYAHHEGILRSRRPDVTLIRPTMIYGSERDRNVHKVVRFANRWRFLPVPGSGKALIQPIHYEDLATTIVSLLKSEPGQTVPAGGPVALSLETSALAIFAALGRRAQLVHVPLMPAAAFARILDGVARTQVADRLARADMDRVVDITRMTAATGVTPRRFEDGVGELVVEMRTSGSL